MASVYSLEKNLRELTGLAPEEKTADAESNKASLPELDNEIAAAKKRGDLQTAAILTAERERIAGQESTSSGPSFWDDPFGTLESLPQKAVDTTTGAASAAGGLITKWIPSVGVILLGIAFVIVALLFVKSSAPAIVATVKEKA